MHARAINLRQSRAKDRAKLPSQLLLVQRVIHMGEKKLGTLQGINISHLGKRKIIFKMPFFGDMLVPWRVTAGYLGSMIPFSSRYLGSIFNHSQFR